MPGDTIVHLGVAAWWIHAFILLFFLVYLPYSKHMHLLWAPVAVFFAEMPHKGMLPPARRKRRRGRRRTKNPLAQFTWRMLLNAYACAECGRCERVCPVAASGAKLSPRQIIHDLKEFVLHEGMAALAGPAGQRRRARNSSAAVVAPEAIWGCATCHACVDKCPVRNEHVALIVEMRRKLVEEGQARRVLCRKRCSRCSATATRRASRRESGSSGPKTCLCR